MSPRQLTVVLPILFLSGCVDIPDTYAPPMQRRPLDTIEALPVGYFVKMSDPHAAAYIVSDINDTVEGGQWRWTRKRPTLRFGLTSTKGLILTADLAIAQATLSVTGPVTISYIVNGHLLDKVRYDIAGSTQFEKAVPSAWLKEGAENLVTLEVDKAYIAEADGAELGFILNRIGFVQ